MLKGSFIYSDDGHEIDIEVFQQIEKPSSNSTISLKKEVASYIYQGAYDKLIDINEQLLKWIQENKYEIIGNRMLIYYVSPENTSDREQMITEICYPIKKLDSIIG